MDQWNIQPSNKVGLFADFIYFFAASLTIFKHVPPLVFSIL